MENIKKFTIPKYGTYFLVFIIISKIIYLGVEIFYNGYLIDVITDSSVTQESLEFIESLGHNVSSVGLTLLLAPFFYLLYKKIMSGESKPMLPVVLVITMVGLFFIFHTALTSLMDKIVIDNKDKRYTSYYISAFKYGMLNGSLGYESLIPKENLSNLKIEDRVILSNIFLLNYIDETLIDKLINKGQNQFADVFILKYGHDEYKDAEIKFENKIKGIVDGYNNYLEKSKEINEKFTKLDNRTVLDAEYQDFQGKLRQKYADYDRKVIKYEKSINISSTRRDKIYKDLRKYFKYQGNSRAEREYKASMKKQFGHYIKPNRWCGKYCPNKNAIEKVIEEEGYKKFIKKSGGIPPDLSQRGFYNHYKVKAKVIKELKAKGLYVSKNFNYSKEQFVRAYKAKINKEFSKVKKQFRAELKKKTGKSIKFGLNYKQFVYSFKSEFTKEHGKKYGTILYNMVKIKDTSEFYSKFYQPKFKKQYLQDYLLSKKDFQTDKHSELGDGAIKHLFIPPFAIGMSLIAGILNFVSVIAMILFLIIKIDKLTVPQQFTLKSVVKLTILTLLIWYPFYKMKELDALSQYKALEIVKENEDGERYVKVLEWIMIYEKINYEKIYSLMKASK
jgi:hypothetical protein